MWSNHQPATSAFATMTMVEVQDPFGGSNFLFQGSAFHTSAPQSPRHAPFSKRLSGSHEMTPGGTPFQHTAAAAVVPQSPRHHFTKRLSGTFELTPGGSSEYKRRGYHSHSDLRWSTGPLDSKGGTTALARNASSMSDLAWGDGDQPTLPFHSTKGDSGGTQGGLTDLHPFFWRADWVQLQKALQSLQDAGKTIDIRKALSAMNSSRETPLHMAAWMAPPSIALMMLRLIPSDKRKKYLMRLDEDKNTPLHLACANVDKGLRLAVVKEILQIAPESLDMQNMHGDSPLHLLVASKGFKKSASSEVEAEEVMTSMIGRSSVVATMRNNSGATVLHAAIANGASEKVLAKLLSLAPGAAEMTDNKGMLPVHYVAAFSGTPWTFVGQLIWANPESILSKTLDGDTPLHLLVSNAQKHLTKTQTLDRNTTKLAELLVGSNDEDVSPLMVQNNESLTPLHCCALFDTPPQLTQLIMQNSVAGAASVLTTQHGATALHLACGLSSLPNSIGNLECLATRNACSIIDDNDRTPVMVALGNKKVTSAVVKLLVKTAPLTAMLKSTQGLLPLHVAVQSSRAKESIIKVLLKMNPEAVKVKAKDGDTVLHEACRHGAPAVVVRMLLEQYPEAVGIENAHGETPLNCANLFLPRNEEVLQLVKSPPGGTEFAAGSPDVSEKHPC